MQSQLELDVEQELKIKAPPIKNQGIKTKLVPFIVANIKWDGRGRWIEPFVGSGAVLFNVSPFATVAADTNEHIIRFYRGIQGGEITGAVVRRHLEFEGALLLAKGEQHFYYIRDRFNDVGSPLDFLFLSRACFNGVMRFNSRGRFNVPFCRKPDRFAPAYITKICNQVDWARDRMAGKQWEFKVQPWRTTLHDVKPEDFVYLDPPYIGRHTDYYNNWTAEEADALVEFLKQLCAPFALSMWKRNRYRTNGYLLRHFADHPMVTFSHFYHVGSTEDLRNEMEEALVLSQGHRPQVVTPSSATA